MNHRSTQINTVFTLPPVFIFQITPGKRIGADKNGYNFIPRITRIGTNIVTNYKLIFRFFRLFRGKNPIPHE
ncbi:MAG: hypothetical protein ACLFQM_03960 [Fidelibacterota bacterium]